VKKVVIYFVIIGVVAAFLLFFILKQYVIREQNLSHTAESLSVLPQEMSADFDVTKNAPLFMIRSANVKNKTLNLTFAFPHTLEGKKVTSQISCKDALIRINHMSGSVPTEERVTIETLINLVQKTPSQSMMFSGLCSDSTCAEIINDCFLSISQK
jgi:hypothetical protein